MPELLLEVGVEELPASMVQSASEQLERLVAEAVEAARLGTAEGSVRYSTPRRLIVSIPNVTERQADEVIEKRGPSAKAAFAADGSPAPPLVGFAKSLGIDPSSVEVRGDYVWAKTELKGRTAAEALAEVLPAAIKGISFEKTMRWGKGRTRFSRPIRWILAVVGGATIPFSIETVTAGNMSRGHRFLAPEEFPANSIAEFLTGLRKRFVEPDPEIRRDTILAQAADLVGETPFVTDELLDENVNLTEWPRAIRGNFKEEFLALPRPVLVTAMAKHEKFFPILDGGGSITNGFVSITNCGDPDTVRRGNEWVLNARFNDAKFYFDEDSLEKLEDFLEKTSRIVFQEKLGTVRQRADRLASLAASFAKDAGLSEAEIKAAETAGRLAKADLSTGLVSELPALQGKVGGAYARRDGFDEAICEAISDHYDAAPSNALATIIMCADQADRLAGYLGIGHAPKGSSDPYGLRRAMTVLVEAQRDSAMPMKSIAQWIAAARAEYEKQGIDLPASGEFSDLLFGRYEAVFEDIPYDAMLAAWAANWDEPTPLFLARAKTLAKLSEDVAFVRSGKRPANIVEAARKKNMSIPEQVSDALFETDEERQLAGAASTARKAMGGEFEDALFVSELRKLIPPIDAFFDKVMVMVDDEKLRGNRLALLASVDVLFRRIGDFSKIVIEGE